MKRILIIAAAIVIAFLAGYAPLQWKNYQSEQRLAETQDRLRAARLEGQLGLLLIEVEQNNFGIARERSTKFFDEVRAALSESKDETARRRLEGILKRRDEVTADLTALKPSAADSLRKLYVEFVTGRAPEPVQ